MKRGSLLLTLFPLFLYAEVLQLDNVDFHYRVPAHYKPNSPIMILFGGKNWPGDKTLSIYNFNSLADKHSLFLLSPSFKASNYWKPDSGTGELLKKAIYQLEERYKLTSKQLYMYGYSAGGQCAALFSQWMPERITALGIHACGVYPEEVKYSHAPILITCGTDDNERFSISRAFIYRYREHGGLIIWKYFSGTGHKLSQEALELARVWFDDLLSERKIIAYGEDDTGQIPKYVDIEYRNPIYSEKMKGLWLK